MTNKNCFDDDDDIEIFEVDNQIVLTMTKKKFLMMTKKNFHDDKTIFFDDDTVGR